jgi:hypothetical protein
MNCQEIFNTVARHLLTQNERATEGGFCSYKNEQGLRCAIGVLIPDGHPAQNYLSSLNDFFWNIFPDLKELWDVNTIEDKLFLIRLQGIHDRREVEEWPLALENFASEYGLVSVS